MLHPLCSYKTYCTRIIFNPEPDARCDLDLAPEPQRAAPPAAALPATVYSQALGPISLSIRIIERTINIFFDTNCNPTSRKDLHGNNFRVAKHI
jgi:hypothetical protein